MDQTPALSRFDEFYRTTTPPWVIGEPQPAVIELERAGLIRGTVLDVGCGTGEHTILLTRLGYDVLGIDFAVDAESLDREQLGRVIWEACLARAPRPQPDWDEERFGSS